MTPANYIQTILQNKKLHATKDCVKVFAPANLALVKYWGKRDQELNLPVTSSLSISMGEKGATLTISPSDQNEISLNNESNDKFSQSIESYLALLPGDQKFRFEYDINIPVAAGFASSSCIFASLVLGLNEICEWNLSKKEMSMIARLGSGSAARSFWDGFVIWHAGEAQDGMDCYAEPINIDWPELEIELIVIDDGIKKISSREAMTITQATSPLFENWPEIVELHMEQMITAILTKDFDTMGILAEENAMIMHEMMRTASPSIDYSTDETLDAIEAIHKRRDEGEAIYFTQDAGPNLKVLREK